MAEYVQIAPGVEGYAFVDPATNELVTLETDQLGTDQIGLVPATAADIEGARRGFAAQGGGQKTLGVLEAAVSGATFGSDAFGLDALKTPEAGARAQVLQQENPILAGGARVAGSLIPTAIVGAATGGLGAAAGLGARAGTLATIAAEDITQAAAYELSEASQQDRDVDVGNLAQGLLEGAAFLGLAHGVGRAFRGARNAGKSTDEVATQVLNEADASSSLARGREQAATREAAERATPTRTEAKHYADNAEEIRGDVNDLAYQAGNSAFGREGSFSQAHSIQYKKADIAGKMTDANIDLVDEVLDAQANALDNLAAKIEDKGHTSAPSAAAARSIRQQAQEIRKARAAAQLEGAGIGAAGGVEDAAIAADRAKRHLDDLRERFGSHATKATDPLRNNVKMIDEVLDGTDGYGLRQILEDKKIWGKDWARKQADENKLWSGKDGIIESRAIWQSELMERAPGAAGSYRTQWGSLPVFQMKDGMVEKLLELGPNKRRQVMKAIEDDLTKTRAMTEIKAEIGGAQARPALDAIRRDIDDLQGVLSEAQRIIKIENTHAAFLAKQRKLGKFDLDEALESIPFVGKAGSIATRAVKKAVNERFTPAQVEATALKASDLRAKIQARREAAMGIKPTRQTAASQAKPRAASDVRPSSTESALARSRARQKQGGWVGVGGGSKSPVDLRGMSLKDLKALDDPKSFKQETLEALRTGKGGRGDFASDFGSSGRVNQKGQLEQGIQIEIGPDGPVLADGRHRLMVGREKGLEEVYGQVYQGRRTPGKKPIYEGPIPIGGSKGEAGSVTLNSEGRNFSLGDVAKSPMGVVTGAGAVAAGAKQFSEDDQAADLAAVAEETRAIRELDQHSKATTERSMLQLSGADVDPPRLAPVTERFQGNHATLTDAYRANISRLKQLTDDPMQFIERTTAAFQGMAAAGHPELAAKLITRLQVGAQYLLANQPPALAGSMFEPEGSPVDEVAVLQFAPIWEAVWHPLDTVRDVGARSAPPAAVKALQEVHPDVYQRAMTESFRTLAQAGPNVDFETKRYLDNVFGFGAAVGRSFSPKMSNLLANERQNNQTPQQRLAGESVLGVSSPNDVFSKGPSSLQAG